MSNTEIIELAAGEPDLSLTIDRVQPLGASDRRAHAPDRTLIMVRGGTLVARLSCWWNGTPMLDGKPVGAIGHYAAEDMASGGRLLARACDLLAAEGCTLAVGPMDGNTWRRYRFVVERGEEPPFFLEPDNPEDWPQHWTSSGFTPLAFYRSAVNDRIDAVDERTDAALRTLEHEHGIRMRPFDAAKREAELEDIYHLSLDAFTANFLYTAIAREEFMQQYAAILPVVRPELVILAEREQTLVGYMFAVPDVTRRMRGLPDDTVILKTLAVHPAARDMRLGGALLDLAQRTAASLGYRRAIHALFHEQNVSGRISGRYARPVRRYALYTRPLST